MNNEFKEVTSMEDVEKALKEMHKAWEDICEAFHVDAQIKLQPEVIRNNIRATMMDLNELENMEYVKKSGKPLEKLHVTYLKCLIKSAYLNLESEDARAWIGEVEHYLGEVITEDVLTDTGLKVEDDTDVTLDLLLTDIQRVFSISNQLNIIKGMESGNLSAETFMSLEDNFIYLGIGIVQTCNGNAVIMGSVVSFIKTLIKINDNILKSISQMLTRQ